jgi:hypothetical protein
VDFCNTYLCACIFLIALQYKKLLLQRVDWNLAEEKSEQAEENESAPKKKNNRCELVLRFAVGP